jgi:hypothetical protein
MVRVAFAITSVLHIPPTLGKPRGNMDKLLPRPTTVVSGAMHPKGNEGMPDEEVAIESELKDSKSRQGAWSSVYTSMLLRSTDDEVEGR